MRLRISFPLSSQGCVARFASLRFSFLVSRFCCLSFFPLACVTKPVAYYETHSDFQAQLKLPSTLSERKAKHTVAHSAVDSTCNAKQPGGTDELRSSPHGGTAGFYFASSARACGLLELVEPVVHHESRCTLHAPRGISRPSFHHTILTCTNLDPQYNLC